MADHCVGSIEIRAASSRRRESRVPLTRNSSGSPNGACPTRSTIWPGSKPISIRRIEISSSPKQSMIVQRWPFASLSSVMGEFLSGWFRPEYPRRYRGGASSGDLRQQRCMANRCASFAFARLLANPFLSNVGPRIRHQSIHRCCRSDCIANRRRARWLNSVYQSASSNSLRASWVNRATIETVLRLNFNKRDGLTITTTGVVKNRKRPRISKFSNFSKLSRKCLSGSPWSVSLVCR